MQQKKCQSEGVQSKQEVRKREKEKIKRGGKEEVEKALSNQNTTVTNFTESSTLCAVFGPRIFIKFYAKNEISLKFPLNSAHLHDLIGSDQTPV